MLNETTIMREELSVLLSCTTLGRVVVVIGSWHGFSDCFPLPRPTHFAGTDLGMIPIGLDLIHLALKRASSGS